MQRETRHPFTALVLASALLAGCSGDGGSSGPTDPRTATVQFVYLSSTTVDPAVRAAFPDCVNGVGRTHIHPSWQDFRLVAFDAQPPDRFTLTFTDVPVGTENRIRVSDPNACDTHVTGASTVGVFANNVVLTRIVDTPGSGIEPGLAFQVSANGMVTP